MSPSISDLPSKPLVIVVGAGLGGLAAAIAIHRTNRFTVLVLEAASILAEIGAGIQVSPNCSRLLRRWDCEKYLAETAVLPRLTRVKRWQTGETLAKMPANPETEQKYGAPHWHVHRADLHDALLRKVQELDIPIEVNAKVVAADVEKGSVTLHTGKVLECGFIVGADGLRSAMRDIMAAASNEVPVPLQTTGDYAYRFTIPTADMMEDPLLADLVEVPMAVAWWGPNMHVVGYKLRKETMFNVVTVFPDDGSLEKSYRDFGDAEHLKETYKDWCPEYAIMQNQPIVFH